MKALERLAHGLQASVHALDARLSRPLQDRLVGGLLALPTGLVLAIAAHLTPDPAGFGTHRQLGLGACTVLTLTGYPCPMCGMTTTFALLAHGRLVDGTLNQPFGLVLFSATVAAFSVGLADLAMGRGLWRRALGLLLRHETPAAAAIIGGMLLGWAYKAALLHGHLPW